MWPSPYLVCVPCVQRLSVAQKELSQPSLSKTRKSKLEKEVKDCEKWIQEYKESILAEDESIKKKLQDTLEQLTCKYKDLALIR